MRELDLQLDYWNRVGPTKPFAHPVNLERLSSWIVPTSRILDFGCGYGRALGFLHSNGYTNLIGMDPAAAMIAAARQSFPTIEFAALNDFRNSGLPAASVDAVLLFAVLTCVPGNDAQRGIIAEITRVLRPRGLLYVSDMFLQKDERNVERYAAFEKKYGVYGVFDLREGVTVRHHDPTWIVELTTEYELLALDEIQVQTMNGHPTTAFQWFGRKQ
jgi:SAM-dependent methyltransferase